MTDLELLELAAKAVGITIDKSKFNGGGIGNTGFDMQGNAVLDWHENKTWNPLTDDGDAFKLAAQLSLSVGFFPWYVIVTNTDGKEWEQQCESTSPSQVELLRAARYAVVRAAAEVERGIQS